jgi:predicted TPR repeat methyltransferase
MIFCNHCTDAEGLFSQRIAERELRQYRKNGPRFSTRLLLRAIGRPGDKATTLTDIGSGIGAIPHELLKAGLAHATVVDASAAYLRASENEAVRRGHRDRLTYYHGDFVELATSLAPTDIVTLDRVICCYPDMEKLVEASSAKARQLYALVYPRERWTTKAGSTLLNAFLRLRGGAFRVYVHPSSAVDAVLRRQGFQRDDYRQTFLRQVAKYSRSGRR